MRGEARPLPLRLSLLVLASICVSTPACGGRGTAPGTLLDGSAPQSPPVELHGSPERVVLTKVSLVRAETVRRGSPLAACLRGPARGTRPQGVIVERIGVSGESLTFRDTTGLHSCDNSPGPREGDRRWCGGSYGALHRGHLRDPRLDVAGCSTQIGATTAFAWVEPKETGARYIVVEHGDYAEAYETAAKLPVRISTTGGINADPLSAVFDLSEYGASGERLRRYRLEAFPAG
jgi:hypothetical protein